MPPPARHGWGGRELTPHRLVLDRYPEDFLAGKSAGFRFLAEVVRECMRSGEFRRGDPVATAIRIMALASGLVLMHQTGRFMDDPVLFRKFYRASIRDLLKWLADG